MIIHHYLPFADERRSVKCLGSEAGDSFPSPPLPPAPTFSLLFLWASFALSPLGSKETETTATQDSCYSAILLSVLLLLGCFPRSRCGARDVCLLYRLSIPFDESKNV